MPQSLIYLLLRKPILAYPTGISVNPTGARKCCLTRGGVRGLVHDVRMMILRAFFVLTAFFRKAFRHHCIKKRSRTEHFLIEKCSYFGVKLIKQKHIQAKMQLSKEEYARKRICNGRSLRIENSVTQDNCLASFGNPHNAEQLLS